MKLRPALDTAVRALLAASEETRAVTLDEIGDALGRESVTTLDIEAVMSALEAAGRAVRGPEGARGAAALRTILPAARALALRLGRRPTLDELARETGIDVEGVRHALALAQVMGR